MQFTVTHKPSGLDALILHVTAGDKKLPAGTQHYDNLLDGLITEEITRLGFKGKPGESFIINVPEGVEARKILVVGTGKRPVQPDQIRQAAATAIKQARTHKLHTIGTPVTGGSRISKETVAEAVVEGAWLADYRFGKYQPDNTSRKDISFALIADQRNQRQVTKILGEAETEVRAAVLARDLVNEPPSAMHPTKLASVAKQIAKTHGLKVEVKGPKDITKAGLHALAAVAKGSDQPPQFIKLQYAPPKAKKHVVLVGKGITYDSGGINLKPSKGGMLEAMKMDMAGAAAVIAAMSAVKELKIPVKVTAYVAATENLLGGSAYKPGDVVMTYNGQTVEVGNTDAEGRLTLADALSYAVAKEKPDQIIDLATLTGAAIAALGQDFAALFTNNETIGRDLQEVGGYTGEKLWPLPLPEEYNELIKGHIAELNNAGTGEGAGSITAALFLQYFTGDTPWAHLDIAGPAWSEKDKGYLKKGGTGFGVRLLLHYLKRL